MEAFSAVATTGIYCRPECSARAAASARDEVPARGRRRGRRVPRVSSLPALPLARRARLDGAGARLPRRPADPRRRARRRDGGAARRPARRLRAPPPAALLRAPRRDAGRPGALRPHPLRAAASRRDRSQRERGRVRRRLRERAAVQSRLPRRLQDAAAGAARTAPSERSTSADEDLCLRLPYDGALDWCSLLGYFEARAIPGVESVSGETYRRTIVAGGEAGVLELLPGGEDHLLLRVHLPHWDELMHVAARARRIANLDADMEEPTEHSSPTILSSARCSASGRACACPVPGIRTRPACARSSASRSASPAPTRSRDGSSSGSGRPLPGSTASA